MFLSFFFFCSWCTCQSQLRHLDITVSDDSSYRIFLSLVQCVNALYYSALNKNIILQQFFITCCNQLFYVNLYSLIRLFFSVYIKDTCLRSLQVNWRDYCVFVCVLCKINLQIVFEYCLMVACYSRSQ